MKYHQLKIASDHLDSKETIGKKKLVRYLPTIFNLIPETVDYRLLEFILKNWKFKYHKSPYGNSYYSGHDPRVPNSYRLSDHWNFRMRHDNKLHCETINNVSNNTHWSIGQYDDTLNKYKIILTFPCINSDDNKESLKKLKEEVRLKYKSELKNIIDKKIEKYSFISSIKDDMIFFVDGEEVDLKRWNQGKIIYEKNGDRVTVSRKRLANIWYQGYYNNKLVIDKPIGSPKFKIFLQS